MDQTQTDAAPAVELAGISKLYRLYSKPAYRVLDLLGLLPASPRFYTTHEALAGVDLTINRGEKVAIIGRNGAGKSTLLKVITGAVRPSAGRVHVRGTVGALLQIGTGFHPDFTGRQNVYSGLAHQGITGPRADELFDQAVAFAELEEYIDQPMKTYSTGMTARLMFAASVMTVPDVLIVDEVLGVGDAYFTHKSFERMRDLCADRGTTLLLVTHDIYSAMKLCDRFVWVDRGRVQFDGDAKTAIGRYEASVKAQEEQRLRQRSVVRFVDGDATTTGAPAAVLQVLFRSRTGFALPAPLAIERLELVYADGDRIALDAGAASGSPDWSLLPEGNLSEPTEVDGRPCRVLRTSGSIYHKAEWSVRVDPARAVARLVIRHNYAGGAPVDVRVFAPPQRVLLKGELTGGHAGWQESSFDARVNTDGPTALDATAQQAFGTGAVRITGVAYLDAAGAPLVRARHAAALCVRVELRVTDPGVTAATLILGFNRPGLPYGCYASDDRLALPGVGPRDVTVDVVLDPLLLGSGTWMVTYAVGEAGLYARGAQPYFTLNDRWYHFVARGSELEVESASGVDRAGCFVVHPVRLTVAPASPPSAGERELLDPPLIARVG